MAQNTNIEWCDHTVNLWWGCSKVHTGCKNCYAETLSNRWGNDIWGQNKPRKRIKSAFPDLNKYQKEAKEKGVYYKIFMGSMMDIFEESKPLINPIPDYESTGDLRMRFFTDFEFNEYPNLIFLLLTKRPENINRFLTSYLRNNTPKNIWFGTSVSNQETFDKYIPELQKVKGNLFLSVEPQIGHINLLESDTSHIRWIIQGGESGHGKRPFKLNWADSMRRQCDILNIPYFFKQIDKKTPIPDNYLIRQFPSEWKM